MPVYEYECQACKYYTEVMQKITDAPLIKCPSCGKRRLKKLVSAPAFRLKGEGWYETDFKSDKEARRNLLAAEKEEAKAEPGTETKQAAAGEGKEATGKEPTGKEPTDKQAPAGKEPAGKEGAGKEAKEPAGEGAAPRQRSRSASRRAGGRKGAAPRLASSRASARRANRRKARRGRR
jgi:putative FmdB family regulatory protein